MPAGVLLRLRDLRRKLYLEKQPYIGCVTCVTYLDDDLLEYDEEYLLRLLGLLLLLDPELLLLLPLE